MPFDEALPLLLADAVFFGAAVFDAPLLCAVPDPLPDAEGVGVLVDAVFVDAALVVVAVVDLAADDAPADAADVPLDEPSSPGL